MNLENELLEKFQVEELEKRLELSLWSPNEDEYGPDNPFPKPPCDCDDEPIELPGG